MKRLEVKQSARFHRDLKLAIRQHRNIALLHEIVDTLSRRGSMPEKHQDHPITGDLCNYRECHITPDWLLIYALSTTS